VVHGGNVAHLQLGWLCEGADEVREAMAELRDEWWWRWRRGELERARRSNGTAAAFLGGSSARERKNRGRGRVEWQAGAAFKRSPASNGVRPATARGGHAAGVA